MICRSVLSFLLLQSGRAAKRTHRFAALLSVAVFWIVVLSVALLASAPVAEARAIEVRTAHAAFRNFESGPVNALLVTPDGARLLALNTPDHRLEVYAIGHQAQPFPPGPGGSVTPGSGGSASGGSASSGADSNAWLHHLGSVFTGLEPVAAVVHPDQPHLAFVSNHVSDTVSIVDLNTLDVVHTLTVGDEPQGLAISNGRIFIACARAPVTANIPGQIDPGELVDNVVVVHSAKAPYARLAIVPVRGLKPRDVCAVGDDVYVIPLNSGNHTTLLNENHTKTLGLEQDVPDAFDGGAFAINPVLLSPNISPQVFARGWFVPNAGRVVFDWEYPNLLPKLPDADVIQIDARSLKVTHNASDVGTTLFDVELNPFTGELWIANTDANNRLRFEPRLNGVALENRITQVPPGRDPRQHLVLEKPIFPRDLAQPAHLTFAEVDGSALAFVASLQSSAVGVLDARRGAFQAVIDTAGIPSGLAVSAPLGLLFVYTRGDHRIHGYDIRRSYRERFALDLPYDPEPPSVRVGRTHLFEARPDLGHGAGRMACASCHVFGHADALAWDLGDPEGGLAYYYPDILDGLASYPGQLVVSPATPMVHPLKGPMVTQSLRGLMDRDEKDDLTLHWRGERRTIHTFQGAFKSLLGGTGIDDRRMQEFATFVRSIDYAPNPFQRRDRKYVGAAQVGADVFGMNPSFTGKPYKDPNGPSCIDCHNADFFAGDDFTGGRPVASAGSFTQLFQTSQLRMVYEKDFRDLSGFGALHDGAVDGIRGFMDFVIPNSSTPTFGLLTDAEKDGISAFGHAFDHGLSPLVGAQLTVTPSNLTQAATFLDFVEQEARPPRSNVDLILKGWRQFPGQPRLKRGAHYRLDPQTQQWRYLFDTGDVVDRTFVLQVVAAGIAEFTFTCVPLGMGERLGVDRDEDGALDSIEVLLNSRPTHPDSDGDGYPDGFELSAGSDPLTPDAHLADVIAPVILDDLPMEVFRDRATISFFTDEPASVRLDVGTTLGAADVSTIATTDRTQIHEIIVTGLPAKTLLHYRITATDRNGNASTEDGSFTTLPPFVHVSSISLSKSGAGPYTVTAEVSVRDDQDLPVAGIQLLGWFSGDLGGAPWQVLGVTDSTGVAKLVVGPFSPSGATEIGFSPAYVGSPLAGNPFFVGNGGDIPSVFYDQTANLANYATVLLP